MSDASKPPYLKYAFVNPYNLAVMGGFAAAAALNGNWWLGMCGAGVEAIWLLFAPDSRLLQKLWFDKRHQAALESARKTALGEKFAALPDKAQKRAHALLDKQEEIHRLAKENPAFTAELLQGELEKLDGLVQGFVELSITCARFQDYLKSIDVNEIEAGLRKYRAALERSEGEQRQLSQKNLEVLEKRKEKYGEIWSYLSSATGQLDLIENTFRLLSDQIVTMRSPTELSGQLDELVDGVEAIRQTSRETAKLLQNA